MSQAMWFDSKRKRLRVKALHVSEFKEASITQRDMYNGNPTRARLPNSRDACSWRRHCLNFRFNIPSPSTSQPRLVTASTSMNSSDDEELQRAIAMSLEEQSDATVPNQPDSNMGEAPPATSTDATANPTQPVNTRLINEGLKQLDRKQLEAERLARQEARKRQFSSAPSNQYSERPSKKARTESEVIDLTSPPRLGHLNSASAPTPRGLQTLPSALGNALPTTGAVPAPRQIGSFSSASSSRRVTEPQYLDGAIKRTWAFGCPRDNDIKIEEVLQGADLNSLLVSTWNFNTEWWKEKIDLEATKQTWIISAVNDEQVSLRSEDLLLAWLTLY